MTRTMLTVAPGALGRMRRLGGELERETRAVVACMRDVDVAQRIRDRAAELGYTL